MNTRIWMGLVMAVLAAGVLALDGWLAGKIGASFYPCLFAGALLLCLLACLELRALLRQVAGPPLGLLLGGAVTILLANWPAHLGWAWARGDAFRHVAYAFTAWVLIAFLWEMATYRPDNRAVMRLALFVWSMAYVGVLPSFFVQLRFGSGDQDHHRGALALAALITVTKGGDVGAYFVGKFLGRHPMSPTLSPKKTWEGFAGGLAASVGMAVGVRAIGVSVVRQELFGSLGEAALFGVVVGVAGVLGDLAESLVKRDCGVKDASDVVPGFGGILDVIDSVIFAAPVAYWWSGLRGPFPGQ